MPASQNRAGCQLYRAPLYCTFLIDAQSRALILRLEVLGIAGQTFESSRSSSCSIRGDKNCFPATLPEDQHGHTHVGT